MIHFLNLLVAIHLVQISTFRVGIFRMKFSLVMIQAPFSNHDADCSLHGLSFLLSASIRQMPGFVTFVKSNAKALLTLRIKSAFAPYGVESCLRTAPRDGRVDGDDVFDTAPTPKNIDTTVTIVTLPKFQARA